MTLALLGRAQAATFALSYFERSLATNALLRFHPRLVRDEERR